jgi:hypothetical protein
MTGSLVGIGADHLSTTYIGSDERRRECEYFNQHLITTPTSDCQSDFDNTFGSMQSELITLLLGSI